MKSQLLSLWDGLRSGSSSQIIVLGATNRKEDIDEAFLRRLPLQIHVPMPNAKQRLQILCVLLSDVQLEDESVLSLLAEKTPFFSGSDLKELCRRVLLKHQDSHSLISFKDFEPLIGQIK